MKKFLLFLTSIVVVVCVGLTTFYFLRNDEVISFKTREIYCNVGDVIELDDLGYSVTKKNRKTTYNYNSADEDSLNKIAFDTDKGYFVAKNGGEAEIVIKTSNKGFKTFKINVHIGDGVNNPYYIENQEDLQNIGKETSSFGLDNQYKLLKDINLVSEFEPIGIDSAFTGKFDGNGKTISGLNITTNYTNAGLFYALGANSSVKDLIINNAEINGNFGYVGALAGEASGTIENVQIKNVNIFNRLDGNKTGGLVGKANKGSQIIKSYATGSINIVGEVDSGISTTVGGLVGLVEEANLEATYAIIEIDTEEINNDSIVGGLVGKFVVGTSTGVIAQSYSASSNLSNPISFIGLMEENGDFNSEEANGLYYLIGNYTQGEQDKAVANISEKLSNLYQNGFYNTSKGLYLVVATENLKQNSSYVYYFVDSENVEYWSNTIWTINTNNYPTLKMSDADILDPTIEYFAKDEEIVIVEGETEKEKADKFLNLLTGSDTRIELTSDIDFENETISPIELDGKIVNGNGYTIKNVVIDRTPGGDVGFFSKVKGSTIKDIKFENITFSEARGNYIDNMGYVAGVVDGDDKVASDIENVTITLTSPINSGTATNFGGFVGKLTSSTISNCSITGLELQQGFDAENVGGVVAINNGTIKEVAGSVTIASDAGVKIGGITGENNSVIKNVTEFNIDINYDGSTYDANIGGVAGVNKGEIITVTIEGNGITLGENIDKTIYVGGVAGLNEKVIDKVTIDVDNIGSCYSGKNVYAGGITAVDSATDLNAGNHERSANIYQSKVTANIAGNYVGGIAARFTKQNSTADQIVVKGSLVGDKFVAGACFEMGDGSNGVGTIKNIQLEVSIEGKTSSTRSSLVALIFPNGAKLSNATVNNSFVATSQGYFYQETWTDYGANKEGFEYNAGTNGASFNIYTANENCGSMQSVIINTENVGKECKSGYFTCGFFGIVSYTNNSESSYVRTVNAEAFAKADTYKGSYTYYVDKRLFGGTLVYSETKAGFMQSWDDNTYTWNLTFSAEGNENVWVETESGIQLNFQNQ